ncbi:armadillo-type protein [Mycena vulgaris]|nr:armadillo-type protein [Mycena vulgaris]
MEGRPTDCGMREQGAAITRELAMRRNEETTEGGAEDVPYMGHLQMESGNTWVDRESRRRGTGGGRRGRKRIGVSMTYRNFAIHRILASCTFHMQMNKIAEKLSTLFKQLAKMEPARYLLKIMNSFTRQGTLESVRSWWSDSNPTGPNINLHALAKPLMKLMYHRQAMYYIAEHRGAPLSRGDVEIYASYLGFKYVSSATKIAVLRQLAEKIDSQDDADTVADSFALYPLDILLESRNAEVQRLTCDLLECLAGQSLNRTAAWVASVCKQLVSLLRDESENVRVKALGLLCWIANNTESAQAAVDAHVLDGVAELLASPNATIRAQSCELLIALGSHKATESAVLEANSCELLVTLLRNAIRALYWITRSTEAMQAALDTNLLDHVAELLESPTPYTRYLMCSMLAAHNGMLATLVGGRHCKQLVSLMRKAYHLECTSAIEALRWISKSPEGARAVVEAGVLKSVNYFLESHLGAVRETCRLLGALASHTSTVSVVLAATPCVSLVSLW